MSTATATKFYCGLPVDWAERRSELMLMGSRSEPKKWSPDCHETFPSAEAREAHQWEAHRDFMQECADAEASRGQQRALPRASYKEPVVEAPDGPHQPPSRKAVANDPSPEQLAMIADLAKRKGQEARPVSTRQQASAEIDRLLTFPDKGLRPNRYAGRCSECGQPVAAEAGFTRKVDDAWVVAHKPGDCPADAPKPVEVPDGYYAVMADAGHLSFYRVKAGRKPGIVFVDLLLGGGGNGTLSPQKVPFRNIPPVLAKIAVDPQGAMELFGKSVGRCGVCNRGLSDQESRDRGIGPECWSRMS